MTLEGDDPGDWIDRVRIWKTTARLTSVNTMGLGLDAPEEHLEEAVEALDIDLSNSDLEYLEEPTAL